jgi:hypothetical protein
VPEGEPIPEGEVTPKPGMSETGAGEATHMDESGVTHATKSGVTHAAKSGVTHATHATTHSTRKGG